MTDEVAIYLSSWIIQDGNYHDFAVGESRAFALEFEVSDAALEHRQSIQQKLAMRITEARYKVAGEVNFVSPAAAGTREHYIAIDFGLPAYCCFTEQPPQGFKIGQWVEGEVNLCIDHYYYFEFLARRQQVPAMIFDWKINRIEAYTGPRAKLVNGQVIRPALSEKTWRDITETDAHAGNGTDGYILHCSRISSTPRRTLTA